MGNIAKNMMHCQKLTQSGSGFATNIEYTIYYTNLSVSLSRTQVNYVTCYRHLFASMLRSLIIFQNRSYSRRQGLFRNIPVIIE